MRLEIVIFSLAVTNIVTGIEPASEFLDDLLV
jgi:hypothetical protein